MTQEQIKAKAKEYFPNDEFKQQIVIDAINWATKELQKENTELKAECDLAIEGRDVKIAGLETRCNELFLQTCEQAEKIEKMKCCQNCENWNWKHNKCEKKLKGDCFKHSKWVMRNF